MAALARCAARRALSRFVGLFARFPNTKEAGRCPACFSMSSAGFQGSSRNLGGAKEGRTPDLLNAIQTLYQLSYSPMVRLTGADSSKTPRESQAEKSRFSIDFPRAFCFNPHRFRAPRAISSVG